MYKISRTHHGIPRGQLEHAYVTYVTSFSLGRINPEISYSDLILIKGLDPWVSKIGGKIKNVFETSWLWHERSWIRARLTKGELVE